MLRELFIRNIALIDELRINFEEGFNVLSGETGAGKSIIIDSVGLICGNRGGRELISTGSEAAYVEALFDMTDSLSPLFGELGIPEEADGSVIISRELHANGRSTCRINGRLQPISALKDIASKLINIHGQNQLGEVLNENNHINILDQFAGADAFKLKEQISDEYKKYRDIKKQIDAMRMSEAERARELDMLSFQCAEIEKAKLRSGEDDELRTRRNELLNSEKISNALEKAYGNLSENALSSLNSAMRALEEASEYSEAAAKIYSAVSDAYYTLEDQSFELSKLRSSNYFSEDELNEIEERRHLINSLSRKYGGSVDAVIEYFETISSRLYDLENSDAKIGELEKTFKEAEKRLKSLSASLNKVRKEAAKEFSARVVQELSELGMSSAKFSVVFTEKAYSPNGTDEIRFEITVNRGEPLKSLAKVVSGGEASRILLAIKAISAERDGIGTLIFDEIDAGISGRIAQVVAVKIAGISKIRQVIAVTHLSQIAAIADSNFFIEKMSDENQTKTSVRRLCEEEKAEEVARLAGGAITEHALEHARELIELAKEVKK